MKNYEDRLREEFSQAEVPSELEPENIKIMLEEKAPRKKRSGIKVAGRIAAGAAACAVIGGSAIYYAGRAGELSRENGSSDTLDIAAEESSNAIAEVPGTAEDSETPTFSAPYMNGAGSYHTVYKMFSRAARNYKDSGINSYNGMYFTDEVIAEEADGEAELSPSAKSEEARTGGSESNEHSDTFNQEDGVLEADKFKTDGRYIYYLPASYGSDVVNIAEAEDGKFVSSASLDVSDMVFSEENSTSSYCSVTEMYLYNDMLMLIGSHTVYEDTDDDVYYWGCNSKQQTFVAFFTTGTDPQLINVYYQEGWYNDARISPDGYLYLITNYNSCSFSTIKNGSEIEKFIPAAGMQENVECIPADDILLPKDGFEDGGSLSYTVIGSIDLNESGTPKSADTKALAGYSGTLYCSAENLYVTVGWEDTDITRLSISGGNITPAASGTVEGYVNDQFSMSEYNGYFRIATTAREYEEVFHKYRDLEWFDADYYDDLDPDDGYYSYELIKQDNRVYVLDMELNEVGMIGDFGEGESVKSVNFSGDLAYVVTFRQTDPLFAIDLSDPTSPAILSELHMNGYSSYMQKWSDGLLFGFGADADDNGRQTGIKLAMYDNSDPNDLRESGVYTMNYTDGSWTYSPAIWDRKALLVAPEKNLIGVPVYGEEWDDDSYKFTSSVKFFSYEDGDFRLVGEIAATGSEDYYWSGEFDRALYIGNYVYALSEREFISADMESFETSDRIEFEYSTNYGDWMYAE